MGNVNFPPSQYPTNIPPRVEESPTGPASGATPPPLKATSADEPIWIYVIDGQDWPPSDDQWFEHMVGGKDVKEWIQNLYPIGTQLKMDTTLTEYSITTVNHYYRTISPDDFRRELTSLQQKIDSSPDISAAKKQQLDSVINGYYSGPGQLNCDQCISMLQIIANRNF